MSFISIVSNVAKPQNAQVALNVVKDFFHNLPAPAKAVIINVLTKNNQVSTLTMKIFKNSIHFL